MLLRQRGQVASCPLIKGFRAFLRIFLLGTVATRNFPCSKWLTFISIFYMITGITKDSVKDLFYAVKAPANSAMDPWHAEKAPSDSAMDPLTPERPLETPKWTIVTPQRPHGTPQRTYIAPQRPRSTP